MLDGLDFKEAMRSWQLPQPGSNRACIGYVGLRLYVMVYVDRESERRIISLRKANRREVERYAET